MLQAVAGGRSAATASSVPGAVGYGGRPNDPLQAGLRGPRAAAAGAAATAMPAISSSGGGGGGGGKGARLRVARPASTRRDE